MICANPKCGKEFLDKSGKLFCSRQCKVIYRKAGLPKLKRLHFYHYYTPMHVSKICVCGVTFLGKTHQKYCSKTCLENVEHARAKTRNHVRNRTHIQEVSDSYIRRILKMSKFSIDVKQLPDPLLKLKRSHLKLKRIINGKQDIRNPQSVSTSPQ